MEVDITYVISATLSFVPQARYLFRTLFIYEQLKIRINFSLSVDETWVELSRIPLWREKDSGFSVMPRALGREVVLGKRFLHVANTVPSDKVIP